MGDQHLIEQLWDLQTRQTELRRHVVQLSTQLSAASKEREVADLTVRELDRLPSSTTTYRVVGKMFVLIDRNTLRSDLTVAKEESLKQDESRTALRDQFVDKLKDAEAQAHQLAVTMQRSPAFSRGSE